VLLPQVGQGALAIECRADDHETLGLLTAIEDAPSRRAVDAERGFLAELGGGCDLPVGAYAVVDEDGCIRLEGLIASHDGRVVLRRLVTGHKPQALGAELAAELLDGAGGRALLG
jgi:hydroxymethylbilane synthase